jgi:hypothetical protein
MGADEHNTFVGPADRWVESRRCLVAADRDAPLAARRMLFALSHNFKLIIRTRCA